jgi:hypothetical protein
MYPTNDLFVFYYSSSKTMANLLCDLFYQNSNGLKVFEMKRFAFNQTNSKRDYS